MVNEHWTRWIVVSLSQHFSDNKGNYKFYLEDQEKRLINDSFELRIVGPIWVESSKNKYVGTLIVNVLVRAVKDDSDFHKIYRMSGFIQKAFNNCIAIKKYGDTVGVDDSNVIIGYLNLIRNNDNSDLSVENFGQVAPEIPLLQTTIEAKYKTTLLNSD